MRDCVVGALAASLLAFLCTTSASAQSEEAKRFGAREFAGQVSLSPDGKHIVALVTTESRDTIAVVSAIDRSEPVAQLVRAAGGKEQLDFCDWADDNRVVCGYHVITGSGRYTVGFGRLASLDRHGNDMKLLSSRDDVDATEIRQNGGDVIDWLADDAGSALLMTRQYVPSAHAGLDASRKGLGVERVDPVTLKRTVVEGADQDAREFITDGHGTVRIVGRRTRNNDGYDQNHIEYFYRKPGDRKWLPLSTVTNDSQTSAGFDPYAVDRDLNVAYGFDNNGGRRALYKIALDGSMKRELVFARPDVDVSGLVRIGRQHRVVGVSYATDRRVTEFFDPELKRLQGALAKAVPGSLISFVGASSDESRLLLWVGSDVDPGCYALYDKKTHHLDCVMQSRPPLADVALAPVKAITFAAADGTQIPAYLTLPMGGTGKGLPAIVMPHGGPSARDEWGFDWLAQFFAARGYAVLQPNFRGSAGYGNAWFQENGFKSWRVAIGDVDDGGRWLVSQGIAAPDKLAIVGWSYGGYAALQSQVLDPDLFKAVVAIAPVTDLNALRSDHENYTDYKLVDAFIGRGPHLKEGSPAQNVDRFKAPVLLFHGDIDQNVAVNHSRMMVSRLRGAHKQVDYVEFKGLDHYLDDSQARVQMLDKADTFLRSAMGIK